MLEALKARNRKWRLQNGSDCGGPTSCRAFSAKKTLKGLTWADEAVSKLINSLIGVGRTGFPLPPNRTCGSPASGSPVSGFTSERVDLTMHGRHQARAARALQSRRWASAGDLPHVRPGR